ncbi:MAG: hypothetical protein NC394_05995 [Bacteroides sp.]|nr:hypothetical protein [Bacteroides sp.]
MRKITIVLLILLVVGILGGVLFFTFEKSDITYVCDYTELSSSPSTSAMVVKRLYSSSIDPEKVEDLSATLLTTAFTEDELLEAALKSGKPEFYPWFSFEVTRKPGKNLTIIEGKIGQTLFEGQTSSRYRIDNLRMEMTSDASPVNASETVIYGANGLEENGHRVVPVVAGDGGSLAAYLDRTGAYDIALDGGSGTVMIQYTYDICTSDALISKKVMEDQLLQVYINITAGTDSNVSATYEVVDAYLISDVY